MSPTKKIAILVSGQGSNLQALIDAHEAGQIPGAELTLVISNRPEAYALARAGQAGIPTLCLPKQECPTRAVFEKKLLAALQEAKIDIMVLAGFDRLLSPQVVKEYPQRILNIHPALLPNFPGLNATRQALDYGAKVTGVTVHFVDEGCDTGPIILQAAVPIEANDTEASLLNRVHATEHRLYPQALALLCADRLQVKGRTVIIH